MFHFGETSDGECVGGRRGLNLGVVEVDHPSILPDHVHLFSAWGRVDRQLLLFFLFFFFLIRKKKKRILRLLVVCGCCSVDDPVLSSS